MKKKWLWCLILVAAYSPTLMGGLRLGVLKAVQKRVEKLQSQVTPNWPQYEDDPAIFSLVITDPPGDYSSSYGVPIPIVPYPSIDVVQIHLGVAGEYFYIKIVYADILPETTPVLNGDTILWQGTNLVFDTGSHPGHETAHSTFPGIDAMFALSLKPGANFPGSALLWYDFSPNPEGGDDWAGGEVRGEFRSGGPGQNYIVARFNITGLRTSVFPRGSLITVGFWSEAQSEIYHHFAFDDTTNANWIVP